MMVVTVEDTSWAVLFLEENTHQSGPNALGRLFNHSSLTGMFSNYNLSRPWKGAKVRKYMELLSIKVYI